MQQHTDKGKPIMTAVGNPAGVQVTCDTSELASLLLECRNDHVEKLLAGAIIRRNGAILLIERVPEDFLGGLFELPSGHVEHGESLLDGLTREVIEETGLTTKEVAAFAGKFDYRTESGALARQLNFEINVEDSEVRLNPREHASHIWCSYSNQLLSLRMSDETKRIVKQALGQK